MIRIKIVEEDKKIEDDKKILLKVKGHSGAGSVGKDIVCASASILTYTVAQMMTDMYKEGKLEIEPEIRLRKGNAKVIAIPKAEYKDEVLHTFFVADKGYKLLAHNYPQYVELHSMFG